MKKFTVLNTGATTIRYIILYPIRIRTQYGEQNTFYIYCILDVHIAWHHIMCNKRWWRIYQIHVDKILENSGKIKRKQRFIPVLHLDFPTFTAASVLSRDLERRIYVSAADTHYIMLCCSCSADVINVNHIWATSTIQRFGKRISGFSLVKDFCRFSFLQGHTGHVC